MAGSPEKLVDQAIEAHPPAERRDAFLSLLRSEHWRSVLASHVVAHQAYAIRGTLYPDTWTFREAARTIAADDEKIQRSLELIGSRFSDVLLYSLAREMKSALVEPALSHLRTAQGLRRTLLLRILHDADSRWVREPVAAQVIRRQLREANEDRSELISALANAGNLEGFLDELHGQPPIGLDEWGALGRSRINDPTLVSTGMASLPHTPNPLAYLMRLDPVPPSVVQRALASARGDWLAASLEVAVLDGIRSTALVPLAELGVRLGGRSLAVAAAWVTSSKLAVDLLRLLAAKVAEGGGRTLAESLRMQYRVPSADRAIEQGRRGEIPDHADAAALVRQLKGRKIKLMVREILREPRPNMVDSVLRPLCAVSSEAAREVVALSTANDKDVAQRARQALEWDDVAWPIERGPDPETDPL